MSNSFNVGDKVFAKVKGYPSWPAKIVSVVGNKYNVEFYGTKETGLIKEENLCYYLRNRDRLSVNLRRRLFHEAVAEIEVAIRKDGGDGDSVSEDIETSGSRQGLKRKRSESKGSKVEDGVSKDDEAASSKEESMDETLEPEKKVEDKDEGENLEIPKTFNFMFISEKYLQNCIAYAKYITESTTFDKTKPVEPRDEPLEPVVVVELPTGQVVGVKMYPKWPTPTFPNELKRALYDETSARRALQCKDALYEPMEEVRKKMKRNGRVLWNMGVTMDEVKMALRARDQSELSRRLDRLVVETSLAHHEIQIKRCLRLDGAEPIEALVHLRAVDAMPLDGLTLRKYPRVVEIARRLRKYEGNAAEWQMSEPERSEFESKALEVRECASGLFEKFKKILGLVGDRSDQSEEGSFSDRFLLILKDFQKSCRGLGDKQKMALCSEPGSRTSFMDRANESDTEKENSSDVANGEEEAGGAGARPLVGA